MAAMPVGAGPLGAWLEPFAAALGEAAWQRAVVLVAGALLAPGRRTVASALRAAGMGHAPGFANHHRVLSEARWSGLIPARLCPDTRPAGWGLAHPASAFRHRPV